MDGHTTDGWPTWNHYSIIPCHYHVVGYKKSWQNQTQNGKQCSDKIEQGNIVDPDKTAHTLRHLIWIHTVCKTFSLVCVAERVNLYQSLGTFSRQQIDCFCFFYQKIGSDISCKLTVKETICRKCLNLLSKKNIYIYIKKNQIVCWFFPQPEKC